jgi:hypothetical protein
MTLNLPPASQFLQDKQEKSRAITKQKVSNQIHIIENAFVEQKGMDTISFTLEERMDSNLRQQLLDKGYLVSVYYNSSKGQGYTYTISVVDDAVDAVPFIFPLRLPIFNPRGFFLDW